MTRELLQIEGYNIIIGIQRVVNNNIDNNRWKLFFNIITIRATNF